MTPHEAVKPLRRRKPGRESRDLLYRALLLLLLVALVLLVMWLDRDGLRDNIDGSISFIDVIYFTVITVTSVGYGDIVPVSDRAKLIDTFFITPIRLFVWLLFLGTAYDFVFRRYWDRYRMRTIQRSLSGHTVLAGFGRSGQEAVNELIARGTPREKIVVVDSNPQALEHATALGLATLEGDATHNAVLEAVRLAEAKAIIISPGRDDTAVLIILTSRQLTRDLPISVVIRERDNEDLAHQAGATTVINPVQFTGLLLAGSTQGSHLADYLSDLARKDGLVVLNERTVLPHEEGKPLSAATPGLGLRIYRDGRPHGFHEPEAQSLRGGDVIVEVLPNG